MDRDDVIRAMEFVGAGKNDIQPSGYGGVIDIFERFASLISFAERERIADGFAYAMQSDLENGGKWLNENAADKFKRNYPAINEWFAEINKAEGA